jgi:hypothetical protein
MAVEQVPASKPSWPQSVKVIGGVGFHESFSSHGMLRSSQQVLAKHKVVGSKPITRSIRKSQSTQALRALGDRGDSSKHAPI